MRKLSPAYVATAVALALGSTAALAQLQISRTNTGTTAAGTSTATASTTGTTVTTTNSATAPSETTSLAGPNVVSQPGVSGPATSASGGTSPSEPFTPDFVNSQAASEPGTVNPGETATTGFSGVAVVPGIGFGGVIADTGFAVNANGERIGTETRAGVSTITAANTPTPIFDLTARQGAAREARRRARGEEPRIYGIAPRTERDLTYQMPDDPVIRY